MYGQLLRCSGKRASTVLWLTQNAEQLLCNKRNIAPKRGVFQRPQLDLQPLCVIRSPYDYAERHVPPPFPQIDIIGPMMIVIRGKIIRSVLCSIVCNNCNLYFLNPHS